MLLRTHLGTLPPESFKARYAMLCIAVPFAFASNPPLLSWLTANLRNTGAITLGVPMNICIGQIGQLIGRPLNTYICYAIYYIPGRYIYLQELRGPRISHWPFHQRGRFISRCGCRIALEAYLYGSQSGATKWRTCMGVVSSEIGRAHV